MTGSLEMCWKEKLFVFDKSCAIFADEVVTSHGPIEADKENIRQEPYSLPQGFMWDTLDLSNADVVSTECVLVSTFIRAAANDIFQTKGVILWS